MTEEERRLIPTYKHIKSGLTKKRNSRFPPCQTLQDLEKLLVNSERQSVEKRKIFEQFSKINEESVYKGTVKTSQGFGLVFINPTVQRMAGNSADIFVDGTFKTTTLGSAQVLNFFRIVQDVVSISLKSDL